MPPHKLTMMSDFCTRVVEPFGADHVVVLTSNHPLAELAQWLWTKITRRCCSDSDKIRTIFERDKTASMDWSGCSRRADRAIGEDDASTIRSRLAVIALGILASTHSFGQSLEAELRGLVPTEILRIRVFRRRSCSCGAWHGRYFTSIAPGRRGVWMRR